MSRTSEASYVNYELHELRPRGLVLAGGGKVSGQLMERKGVCL